MASKTYFVMVAFKRVKGGLVAQAGVQCPSERSAVAQARGAVARGAAGAIAFMRNGDPETGEYSEPTVICREGKIADAVVDELLAA